MLKFIFKTYTLIAFFSILCIGFAYAEPISVGNNSFKFQFDPSNGMLQSIKNLKTEDEYIKGTPTSPFIIYYDHMPNHVLQFLSRGPRPRRF